MEERKSIYADWNPWHGCTKISPGCMHCYVYRQDAMRGAGTASNECRRTGAFANPVKKTRGGSWKIPSGSIVFTCFSSDFLLKDADPWREECWRMMRARPDLWFYFFTKRIERLREVLPADWGDGYENVLIGCTVENDEMAKRRLPVFLELPVRHRSVICAPLLGPLDLAPFLGEKIEEVSVGGESGPEARPCDFDWVLDIRRQCIEKNIPFRFHQTGANFIKDGKQYHIKRYLQKSQAAKAGIDFRIGAGAIPETAAYHGTGTEKLTLFGD